MKKVLLLGAAALFSAGILFTSCDDDSNPISCTQTALELAAAQSAYLTNPTTDNCNEYKRLINDYLECDIASTVEDEYKDIINSLDC